MPKEILLSTVRTLVEQLAKGDYDRLISGCVQSRLASEDLRQVIQSYGRKLVAPPINAYQQLDAVQIKGADVPSWSVRVPVWTEEEGRSDLTLELTIALSSEGLRVELDDLHVL